MMMENDIRGDTTSVAAKKPVMIFKKPYHKIIDSTTSYVFVLPWLIIFLAFTVYPLIYSFYASLTNYAALKPETIKDFVWLNNYIELFSDAKFHMSLLNTLKFSLITIPITTVLALLLAVSLNQGAKFNNLFRIGFFFPTVTSLSVISLLWLALLYKDGIISKFVELLGFKGRNWLTDSSTALPSIMVMCIWSAIGFYMLIYVSALQNIPNELYEAATVDGANGVQKFFKITLPYLRHTTIYVVVLNTINSLQIFTEPQIMTKGGPGYATTTSVLYLYRTAFTGNRMGYASAVGYVLFFIILLFSLIQTKVFKLNKGVDD